METQDQHHTNATDSMSTDPKFIITSTCGIPEQKEVGEDLRPPL